MACGKSDLACQLSLYPLGTGDYGKVIKEVLKEMEEFQGLDIEVGPMSTLIRGPQENVWELVKRISYRADQKGGFVLNLSVSNVCGC